MDRFKKLVTALVVVSSIYSIIPQSNTLEAKQKSSNLILATTTSTVDSGLLDELIPLFEKKSGLFVKTISVGSGQAIALARKGEVDVLLVHSPDDEARLMRDGIGVSRRLVMHNDFIIAGPRSDPAGIKGTLSSSAAFSKIASTGSLFISRGDNSGTHAIEKKIWKLSGVSPEGKKWYQQTGLGMGQTLFVSDEKKGYTIADRGTYLALKKKIGLDILVEGDARLMNIYHVIELNGEKFNKINREGAKAFADFIVSKEAQDIIKKFGVNRYGSPLFFPDAGKKSAPVIK